jgi:uncharacterized DUF497 family protein
MAKPFQWDIAKNAQLIRERGLCFEQVTVAIESGDLIQIVPHNNQALYPKQKVMIVNLDGYAYLVPFVEEDEYYFLKTIIPSRKATRDFITDED